MNGELRSLADGRWVLRRGGRRWVLSGEAAARFAQPGGDPEANALMARRRDPRRPTAVRLRATLLPASAVDAIARRLAPLTAWPLLGAWSAAGIAAAVAGLRTTSVVGASWPAAAALLVVVLLVHELGHAAALRKGGGRPGAVGIGVAFVVPAFWCDVTEAALLDRGDRVRVDLAGVAWQAGLVGVLAGLGLMTEGGVAATLALAARFAAVSAAWSLAPLLRTDGAWALCDALGVRDLEAPLPAAAGGTRCALAAASRWATALALVAVAIAGPMRAARLAGDPWRGPPPLDALVILAVGALWWSSGRRAARLIAAAVADLLRKRNGPRGSSPGPAPRPPCRRTATRRSSPSGRRACTPSRRCCPGG